MDFQYIEKEDKLLYSIYNPPQGFNHEDIGVVLCYPYGQEYTRCHKLYSNMAQRLSQVGFHVLRFDYYGTGDSDGEFSHVTLNSSIKDLKLAVDELKEACGVSKVILMGVRMGATLSLFYSKQYPISGLILWNPILEGQAYLKEIDEGYRRWLNGSFTKEERNQTGGMANFGYLFSQMLLKELKAISVRGVDINQRIPTLLISNSDYLRMSDCSNTTFIETVNKEYWMKRENELDKGLIPVHELNSTVEWITSNRF